MGGSEDQRLLADNDVIRPKAFRYPPELATLLSEPTPLECRSQVDDLVGLFKNLNISEGAPVGGTGTLGCVSKCFARCIGVEELLESHDLAVAKSDQVHKVRFVDTSRLFRPASHLAHDCDGILVRKELAGLEELESPRPPGLSGPTRGILGDPGACQLRD